MELEQAMGEDRNKKGGTFAVSLKPPSWGVFFHVFHKTDEAACSEGIDCSY